MSKPYEVANFSIVYKNVFSWEWLYKTIHFWLIDEGYVSWKGQGGDKWKEENFVQRVTGNGKEVWIWWRTTKSRKTHPYIKFYLNVDYHTLGLKDTEIMHEGKKIKLQKGEVEVFIKAQIQFDPDEKLAKLPWMKYKYVKNWFEKRWYRQEIRHEEIELYEDAFRLQNAIKQYFNLKGWVGEYSGEPFIPKKGIS